jgi:hypothetical protein
VLDASEFERAGETTERAGGREEEEQSRMTKTTFVNFFRSMIDGFHSSGQLEKKEVVRSITRSEVEFKAN